MNKIKIKFIPLLGHGEEKEFNNKKELEEYLGYFVCIDMTYSRKLNTYITLVTGLSTSDHLGAIYLDDNGDLFTIKEFDSQYSSCLEGDGFFELIDEEFNVIDPVTSLKLYSEYTNRCNGNFKANYPFVIWYNK